MNLDAPTYKTVLTPEAAMGIIQKDVAHRGWKKVEVEDVRLVYVPYYVFGFDVAAEGTAPISGKAALNAYTGDVDEIVPMILERPLSKQTKAEPGAEIEETSIAAAEAREVAKDKISFQTAVKKDRVSVSAITKVYIPYYRVWGTAGHSSFRAQVDALLGSVVGLEGVHEKPKSWGEAAKETFSKMATPSGIAELGGKTIGAISGGGGHGGHGEDHGGGHGGGGGFGGMLARKEMRWVLILAVIGVLAYLFIYRQTPSGSCTGEIMQSGMNCTLQGVCGFSNPKTESDYVTTRIQIFQQGQERLDIGTLVGMLVDAKGSSDVWRKEFNVTWASGGVQCSDYSWKSGKI